MASVTDGFLYMLEAIKDANEQAVKEMSSGHCNWATTLYILTGKIDKILNPTNEKEDE
jgi:hypothetical protein